MLKQKKLYITVKCKNNAKWYIVFIFSANKNLKIFECIFIEHPFILILLIKYNKKKSISH